jgi:SAM-dependent methyltransferase
LVEQSVAGNNSVSARPVDASSSTDGWASGNAYEPYVGRWSRLVARKFVEWLAPAKAARWLDVGCGTGALTSTILNAASPSHVEAVDSSDAYISFARNEIRDPRAVFTVADAQSLPQDSDSVDIVVSGLALNFIPRPDVALAEIARVVRPGGTIAVYVWDYAGEMQLIRRFWDAAIALDPRASALDEANRFPICNSAALETLFGDAQLQKIESRAIDVPTVFRDFDDYWMPFLGGQGPAPGYAMSLTEDRRADLRKRIRGSLPIADDGSIPLVARAWAVRGTRAT